MKFVLDLCRLKNFAFSNHVALSHSLRTYNMRLRVHVAHLHAAGFQNYLNKPFFLFVIIMGGATYGKL